MYKTLSTCLKPLSKFKDFVDEMTIYNLIFLVQEQSEGCVDLKIYYIQNGRYRYVSSGFYQNHNVEQILKASGFEMISKKYCHFDKDGNLNKNLFRVFNQKMIVKQKGQIKKMIKDCLNLKKKRGRPKIGEVKRISYKDQIHNIMNQINFGK